jgi:F-type H+-transporting ATPase subunit c
MRNKMNWIFASIAVLITSLPAFAEEAVKQAANTNDWKPVAAALALGIAAFGGALGQGKTAAAALDGIARNPSARDAIFVPMIIGLALIESLVIYALINVFV